MKINSELVIIKLYSNNENIRDNTHLRDKRLGVIMGKITKLINTETI